MHPKAAAALVAQIRQREREGDCPTTPALSVETLEDLVLTLADRLESQAASRHPGEEGIPK